MHAPLSDYRTRFIKNDEERVFARIAIKKGLVVRRQIPIDGGSLIDFHVINPKSKRGGRYVEITRTRGDKLFETNEHDRLDPRLTKLGTQKSRQLENMRQYSNGGVILCGEVIDRLRTKS